MLYLGKLAMKSFSAVSFPVGILSIFENLKQFNGMEISGHLAYVLENNNWLIRLAV